MLIRKATSRVSLNTFNHSRQTWVWLLKISKVRHIFRYIYKIERSSFNRNHLTHQQGPQPKQQSNDDLVSFHHDQTSLSLHYFWLNRKGKLRFHIITVKASHHYCTTTCIFSSIVGHFYIIDKQKPNYRSNFKWSFIFSPIYDVWMSNDRLRRWGCRCGMNLIAS